MSRVLSVFAALGVVAAYDWDPRSKIPGYGRRDVFNEGGDGKKSAVKSQLPDCPKTVEKSPFWAAAMVDKVMYVRYDEEDEECYELLGMDNINYTKLVNASKTQCGDGGHVWSTRIMEEMSVVFWAAGAETYGQEELLTVEMKDKDGKVFTKELPMSEEQYTAVKMCWFKGCGCPQAAISMEFKMTLAVIILACLIMFAYDSNEQNKKDKRKMERKLKKKSKEEKKAKKAAKLAAGGTPDDSDESSQPAESTPAASSVTTN